MSHLSDKLKARLVRLTHYEFWPFWLFYAPVYPYGLWLALRSWSLTYFSATNPSMRNGGAFAYSKFNILNKVNSKYLPKSIFFPAGCSIGEITATALKQGIDYPFIVKPDAGERGKAVEKINNEKELIQYLNNNTHDLLVQEFIEHPVELGILYYRYPGEKTGHIKSVVIKDFLTITGDGNSTIYELINKHPRTQQRLGYLENKYRHHLGEVLKDGEVMLLEPIGNHSRGTTFLNGNHLINNKLVEVFDKITEPIEGFYYGRFDFKVKSVDDLYAGQNIKIMEVNGVNSEPAHIYDPDGNIFSSYRDILHHMKVIYDISSANRRSGHPFTPLTSVMTDLKSNLFPSKKQVKNIPSQETAWT